MRVSRLSFLAIAFLMISFAATARAETFYAYLTGAQEVPPVATNGTGYARVFVNESTMTLTFTVVFNNLSSNQTLSHIHAPAAIGASTGVAIDFGTVGGTSGTITGTRSITPTQLSQIRQHLGYVNVHSVNFPGGELRGQLGIKRPVDFDGDGRQDYSVLKFPAAGGAITYWNANSQGSIQTVTWGDTATDFPAPGDYDGDGKDDFVVWRSTTVVTNPATFWILRSSDNTAQASQYGLGGDQVHARDFDGDGKTDQAVVRRGATAADQLTWWIHRSSDDTDFVVKFGLTGNGTTTFDTPVSGDYDGDGKFDIAVYRFGLPPANNFIYRRSSDGAIVFVPFGNFNTDYILPGDYDGDGKYDFCAGRTGATGTSPMVWWILQSSNGAVRVQQFGISSDIPVQGDYDGDARTDIAVYRRGATAAANSNFWVLRSFDLTTSVTTWGQQPDFAVASFDAR